MKRVSIVLDRVPQVIADLNRLIGKQVLVGIPDATSDREGEEKGPITNAALGYIHEFGSPAANIPARPFLIPGVQKSEESSTAELRRAAEAALDGDASKADQMLNRAGLVASASAKREISTAPFVPLQPDTVYYRHASRSTKTMRKAEIKYLELIDQGVSPKAAQDAAGIQPLINTGALRNSLTYVVTEKK